MKYLDELTGLLTLCVRAIPAVRAFKRRLYNFLDITFLDLVPIAKAFAEWCRELRGKKVILYTENQASVILPLS